MKLLFTLSAVLTLTGCDASLSVMPGILSSSPSGKEGIFSLDRLQAEEGERIRISGANLTPGMTAQIGEQKVTVNLTSSSSASFVMPQLEDSSALGITFYSSDMRELTTLALVPQKSLYRIPVMDVDPQLICSDISFRSPNGQLKTGLRRCEESPPTCQNEGEVPCVTTNTFPPVNAASLPVLAANLREGNRILNFSGSLKNCETGNPDNCVTSPDFPSIEKSALSPGIIKSGVSLAGITGSFAAECHLDGQTSCLTSSRFKSVDTSAMDQWDLRLGKTAGGISGRLEFLKNRADLSQFNRSSGDGASAGIDFYDTLDDSSNYNAIPSTPMPGFSPLNSSILSRHTASDTDGNGACDAGEDCIYKDNLTGMLWAKPGTAMVDWEGAITICDLLNYGGHDDWRLPTQKEQMQMYIDGIQVLYTTFGISAAEEYWSATTVSWRQQNAFLMYLDGGGSVWNATSDLKTNLNLALCVR